MYRGKLTIGIAFCILFCQALTVSTIRPQLQKCFQSNNIDGKKAFDDLYSCEKKYISIRLDHLPQTIETLCNNTNNIENCYTHFEKIVKPCLDGQLKKSLTNVYAFIKSTDDYFCQDEGERVSELLENPKKTGCSSNLIHDKENCQECQIETSSNNGETANLLSMFDKFSCQDTLSKIENCFTNCIRKHCDKNDLLDYIEEGIRDSFNKTTCSQSLPVVNKLSDITKEIGSISILRSKPEHASKQLQTEAKENIKADPERPTEEEFKQCLSTNKIKLEVVDGAVDILHRCVSGYVPIQNGLVYTLLNPTGCQSIGQIEYCIVRFKIRITQCVSKIEQTLKDYADYNYALNDYQCVDDTLAELAEDTNTLACLAQEGEEFAKADSQIGDTVRTVTDLFSMFDKSNCEKRNARIDRFGAIGSKCSNHQGVDYVKAIAMFGYQSSCGTADVSGDIKLKRCLRENAADSPSQLVRRLQSCLKSKTETPWPVPQYGRNIATAAFLVSNFRLCNSTNVESNKENLKKCVEDFENDIVNPCNNSDTNKIVSNMYAFTDAIWDYVCKEDGKYYKELLSNPGELTCTREFSADRNARCKIGIDSGDTTFFQQSKTLLKMFDNDACERFIANQRCVVNAYADSCGPHELRTFIQLEVQRSGLKATSCKDYVNGALDTLRSSTPMLIILATVYSLGSLFLH